MVEKIRAPRLFRAHSWKRLETAKTGLETLIALLKEDKPAVLVDPVTGAEFTLPTDSTVVKGLKVAKLKPIRWKKQS